MLSRCIFPIVILVLTIFTTGLAHAAEHDGLDDWCSKVKLPSSIVLCTNHDLRQGTIVRNKIFADARSMLSPDDMKALMAQQSQWVKEYSARCGIKEDSIFVPNPPADPLPDSIINCFRQEGLTRIGVLIQRLRHVKADYIPSDLIGEQGDIVNAGIVSAVALGGPQTSAPMTLTTAPTTGQKTEIALVPDHGTYAVPVRINDKIDLNFTVDSGAATVVVGSDVVSTLERAGTISESDFTGYANFSLADGSTRQSRLFIIHTLQVGSYILHDIHAAEGSEKGDLLLGQSFLEHFGSWTMDNSRHVLVLTDLVSGEPPISSSLVQTAKISPNIAPPSQPESTTMTSEVLCGKSASFVAGSWILTGTWNNSRICGALIMSGITKDGHVDLTYVYGSNAGSHFPWKQQHAVGQMQIGPMMTFQDDEGSTFTFHFSGTTAQSATAEFQGRSGHLTASFTRIQ